jgi:GNAT superfamily N-acetyltransferase
MTVPVTIDIAVSSHDYATVRTLVQRHVIYEQSDVVMPDDWEQLTANQVSAGNVVIFIARADGCAIGYASLTSDVGTWTGERFGHLDCLYVDESRRGTGLGSLLVEAVASEARARGYSALQWQTPAWNSTAIRFYERLGATHRSKERFALVL